jgi:hypothetical protein
VVVVTCCLAILVGGLVVPSSPAAAFTTVVYSGAGPNVPRISVIGDSVGSGIRWTRSYAPLARFNFTFDAESCRRTIVPSCRFVTGFDAALWGSADTGGGFEGWVSLGDILREGGTQPLTVSWMTSIWRWSITKSSTQPRNCRRLV